MRPPSIGSRALQAGCPRSSHLVKDAADHDRWRHPRHDLGSGTGDVTDNLSSSRRNLYPPALHSYTWSQPVAHDLANECRDVDSTEEPQVHKSEKARSFDAARSRPEHISGCCIGTKHSGSKSSCLLSSLSDLFPRERGVKLSNELLLVFEVFQ